MALRILVILALIALPAMGAPPTTCGGTDDYSAALCAYQQRRFSQAEQQFRAMADSGVKEAKTIKAMYFLGRTLMKTGRFDDAAKVFIRIYEADKPFYDEWQCDFLLGECRRAVGKG